MEISNLTKVSNPVFSQEKMGDGFTIKPSDGQIIAPINGILQAILSTLHRLQLMVTLVLTYSFLLLDTMTLNSEGERIKLGDQLVDVGL